MGKQLLLVEDDDNLGYILKEYLEMSDLQTDWAKNGEEGSHIVEDNDYDLCILDIMMPKKDGFTLAKEIKERDEKLSFVFLTAKTLKVDQLKGFDLGAADYIVKPIDEEVLITKINAILNRFNKGENSNSTSFSIGEYTFNYNKRELSINQTTLSLTPRESDLLQLLCKNKREVITRRHALKNIWGENNYSNRRIMDVYISKLRKYLSDDPNIEIKNIHSTGFILSD